MTEGRTTVRRKRASRAWPHWQLGTTSASRQATPVPAAYLRGINLLEALQDSNHAVRDLSAVQQGLQALRQKQGAHFMTIQTGSLANNQKFTTKHWEILPKQAANRRYHGGLMPDPRCNRVANRTRGCVGPQRGLRQAPHPPRHTRIRNDSLARWRRTAGWAGSGGRSAA